MSTEHDKLLDHDYDGIKELDNDLPRWWLWLFYITIIWSVLYMLYYHVADIGYLQEDEYQASVNPAYVKISAADTKFLGVLDSYHSPFYKPEGDITPRMKLLGAGIEAFVEETAETDTVTYIAFTDPNELALGKDIFLRNCVQCHGPAGEGGIGPNLTDKYWIHPPDFNGLVKSVKYGYPAKGMISWRSFLKSEDIIRVSSYIQTLKNTNAPGGKAPQGEIIEE